MDVRRPGLDGLGPSAQRVAPVGQEVGDALVSYVQEGRPRSHTDRLFLRSSAPFRGFRSHPAVSVIVATAFRRAGINRPGRGAAHLLRHSIASSRVDPFALLDVRRGNRF